MTTTKPLPSFGMNVRALEAFLASGLPDTYEWRHAVMAEAHHMMNHVGDIYSACVASACRALAQNPPRPASAIAAGYLEEAGVL